MIKILKSPKVIIVKGRERTDKTGFKILKPIARSMPPIMYVRIPSCKISPWKRRVVTYSEKP